MPQLPYIPTQDAAFANWLNNFATLILATPTDYGLVAGDGTIIDAARDDFAAKYLLATNPTTRTSATIANKDASRASATATVRPYAIAISRNSAVSDALKIGVGVNLPNPTRTPIPAPLTAPLLGLLAITPGSVRVSYTDSGSPDSKAKPYGVVHAEVYVGYGTAPIDDPDEAAFLVNITKSPVSIDMPAAQRGKICTMFSRWVTRSGPGGKAQGGPFSAPLSFTVA